MFPPSSFGLVILRHQSLADTEKNQFYVILNRALHKLQRSRATRQDFDSLLMQHNFLCNATTIESNQLGDASRLFNSVKGPHYASMAGSQAVVFVKAKYTILNVLSGDALTACVSSTGGASDEDRKEAVRDNAFRILIRITRTTIKVLGLSY